MRDVCMHSLTALGAVPLSHRRMSPPVHCARHGLQQPHLQVSTVDWHYIFFPASYRAAAGTDNNCLSQWVWKQPDTWCHTWHPVVFGACAACNMRNHHQTTGVVYVYIHLSLKDTNGGLLVSAAMQSMCPHIPCFSDYSTSC